MAAVGERFESPPELGAPIVTLASLTLTPLRLESVDRVDPGFAQIEVTGFAYVADLAPWGPLPTDLPLATALELYDVYTAGSHTFELAREAETVYVLGAGHAGKLALAAARDATPAGPWSRSTSTGTRSSGSRRSGSATSRSPPTCATRWRRSMPRARPALRRPT